MWTVLVCSSLDGYLFPSLIHWSTSKVTFSKHTTNYHTFQAWHYRISVFCVKLEAVIRDKSLTYTEHTSANLGQHSEIKLRQEIMRWSQETVECKGTSDQSINLHVCTFRTYLTGSLTLKFGSRWGFALSNSKILPRGVASAIIVSGGGGSFTKFGYRLKVNSHKNIVTILECDYRRGTDCIFDLLTRLWSTSIYRAIADLLILQITSTR